MKNFAVFFFFFFILHYDLKREPSWTSGPKAVCNEVAWNCNDKLAIASINSDKCVNKIKVWARDGRFKHELNVTFFTATLFVQNSY